MPKIDDRTRMKPSETLADFEKRLKEIGKKAVVLVVDDDSADDFDEQLKRKSLRAGQSAEEREIDDFLDVALDEALADEPPYYGDKE
jgi:hypothetical protein